MRVAWRRFTRCICAGTGLRWGVRCELCGGRGRILPNWSELFCGVLLLAVAWLICPL